MRAGRAAATTDDVRKAMRESVIPADKKLQMALEVGRKTRRDKTACNPSSNVLQDDQQQSPERAREDLEPESNRTNPRDVTPRVRVPGALLVEA
jgi:hypothetical protein